MRRFRRLVPRKVAGSEEELSEMVGLVAPVQADQKRLKDIRNTLKKRAQDYLEAVHDEDAASTPGQTAALRSIDQRAAALGRAIAAIERAKIQVDAALAAIEEHGGGLIADLDQLKDRAMIMTSVAAAYIPKLGAPLLSDTARTEAGATGVRTEEKLAIARRLVDFHGEFRPAPGGVANRVGLSPLSRLVWAAASIVRDLHGPGRVTAAKDGMTLRLTRLLYIYATGDADDGPDDTLQRLLRGAIENSQQSDGSPIPDFSPGWGLRALALQKFKQKRN